MVSFDPAVLRCITCDKEHKILGDKTNGQPATLCFTDQNFVSALKGDGESCVSVFQLENASLTELTDIMFEAIDSSSVHPGTVILMGSTSLLYRIGVSLYAREWAINVARIEHR
jgi:hypothetical protein